MLNWLDPIPVVVPPELADAVGGDPLVARLLAQRGYTDPARALAFLDPRSYTPAPPEDLPDLEVACERIDRAIQNKERIWVWGDFDVDGQTSTALLVSVLRLLGCEPGYHIPVRATESHGVNIPNLEKIITAGADLLLTCDTGITALEALTYAQEKGLEVIVTDHHALGASLPPAFACVTPRRLPKGHPLEGLPGVGVAFMLAQALLTRAGRASEANPLLDLAALGIVADVAMQTGDTRYLLQRGLDVLRRGERTGIRAIYEQAEVQAAFLTEEHIGFTLGPRLNALGRLSDANPAVELFTTSDPARARVLAQELEALNAKRQMLTRSVLEGALALIQREPALLDPPVLILAHPEWPAGVIGIVASQLKERFNRPIVMLTAPPGEAVRGSARSIDGVDITACIATQSNLLNGFGGHPMAAGMSLPPENLPAFRRGLARAVQAELDRDGGLPPQALRIDAWLDLDAATLDLVADLERLAPFGPGNPALTFGIRNLTLASHTPIGRGNEHLQMIVQDEAGQTRKVLWWGGAGWPLPQGRFDLACSLRASNFRGQHEVQVTWVDFRPLEEESVTQAERKLELIDQRTAVHPKPLLEAARSVEGTLIWAEAEAREAINGILRADLQPAQTLVIWTTPPGRSELQAALDTVHPRQVIIFAVDPAAATPEAFLQRLAGLIKSLLNRTPGAVETSLARLAAACGQREGTVRKGLAWLEAKGQLRIVTIEGGRLIIEPGGGTQIGETAATFAQIRVLIDETNAYRRYFHTAPLETLI